MKDRWTYVIIAGLAAAALFLLGLYSFRDRQNLDYAAHLDDAAVTVDGEDMTLSDMAFYVVYVERKVEESAMIYDDENTRAFWNIHTNQTFTQTAAKETVMDMAVHDRIFYRAALQENLVLSEEEAQALEEIKNDFWEDLLDVQRERLPVSYEVINETIKEIALTEKYQSLLAEKNEETYAAYGYDGYDYKEMLKEHEVKIHKSIWNRINVGNITLVHEIGRASCRERV